MSVTAPALRYHGAKFRLANWVMSFFPQHTCYVEPFGGAAGVLLQKPRAYAEVYNDLDGGIVNFFRVLRDPVQRQQLIDACVLTPYARDEFEQAWEPTDDPIEKARRLCIRAQMGFGSAGASKGTTGFRVDTKREYGTAQALWQLYPAAIASAGERMTGVLIENRDGLEVMAQHDAPTTLHFVDPPYMHQTRVNGNRTYAHELSNDQHEQLLRVLLELEGFVVLSGYKSELYGRLLEGWEQHTTSARISAGRGTAMREECVWLNPACAKRLRAEAAQRDLFSIGEGEAA